jgi:hypothetical protein
LLNRNVFKKVTKEAISAASTINKSSAKYLVKLRNCCETIYGKKAPNSVATVGETRWNSTQTCFASMLRIRTACTVFVTTYKDDTNFPEALLVWKEDLFWKELEEAELLIRPLSDASHLMQRKINTMKDVFLVLVNLTQHITEFCGDSDDASALLSDIEARWNKEDQHLFFLAFALHPLYRGTAMLMLQHSVVVYGNWNRKKNPLTVVRLQQAAEFYFQKHKVGRNIDQANLLDFREDLGMWLRGDTMESIGIFRYKKDDGADFWLKQEVEHPELAAFAAFLHDANAASASCETVFKEFARQHTKLRHNLGAETVHNLTVIKHNLPRKYPQDAERKANKPSSNKIMDATEHTRIDKDDGTPASLGVVEMEEEDEDDEEDEDEEQDGFLNPEGEEDDIYSHWQAVMDTLKEDDDPAEEDTDDDTDDDEEGDHDKQVGSTDCFEKVDRGTLKDLPPANDPNYPQENARYFAQQGKRFGDAYVRNDKFTLKKLYELAKSIPEESDDSFPTIMSAFEHQKDT